MFENIFSKTKKTKKQKIKPKIIADIHEKNSLILAELQSNQEIELEIKNLEIADYLIGKTAIERKTVSDFISSMLNKRLVEQLRNLQKYKQKLLIIEGVDEQELYRKDTKLNPNAIRGMILSIITNYETPIIFTQNYEDTANYLITLAKQQLKKPIESSLHSRIPKTIKEQKQYILESFPNIGPITAKNLLKEFKNLNSIFNSSEEQLSKILKSKSKYFKKLLYG
ncbi:MAG: ERCC4 domain-containing protein [Candidatus Pacearchaeota archaeon]